MVGERRGGALGLLFVTCCEARESQERTTASFRARGRRRVARCSGQEGEGRPASPALLFLPAGSAGRMERAGGRRRPPHKLLLLLLLYLPLLPGLVLAFNLDTDNVVMWSGDSGSLFGFSLAMHRQLQPQDRRL